ncbi:MAG: hypothetical protein A3K19_32210 [Lentisphaerae bacterium RIFOXYB12_FULL_65_16]|nr:MAG: hypothetical protein A3K18_12720 [Lentisphaerae bacterium RIFOXYA12_64_32]OGV88765.1 MAG: hypothetical protein A3K19_32210 [Lentisphaerae bacterium RIFOXYB12_FULL_65_16]
MNGSSLAGAFLGVAFAVTIACPAAPPTVFSAADPTGPGETVIVVGDSLGAAPEVKFVRLDDGKVKAAPTAEFAFPEKRALAVKTEQPAENGLKFVVPADVKPGVFAFAITTPAGTAVQLINRPVVWWCQGEVGSAARPGGILRLFGKNMSLTGATATAQVLIEAQKPLRITATADDPFSARATLPPDLAPGSYKVRLHNGHGGPAAWSDAVDVVVESTTAWPDKTFNVLDAGADSSGASDSTAAIATALDQAKANGGGVVLLPRGRYRITETLTIPRQTVLRGESREVTCLFWPDFETPPEALVTGADTFGVEELTLYASTHKNIIAADQRGPEAGHVFLRKLRIRGDAYRGHLKPEDVDRIFTTSMKWSTGGGDSIRLGGPHIEITDCDVYGTGRALYLSRVCGGRVANNTFYNGRWGWYCIAGSNGLVVEDNSIIGADLMSTGGGLNCLDGSAASERIYFARNRFSLMHGWDREAMTSDAGGEMFYGKIVAAEGTTLTLPKEVGKGRDWRGAAVFVLDGKGAGQYRRVASYEGSKVEIDRPWAVPPDSSSEVGMTMFQGQYLIVYNEFADTGAMQFYGTSIDCFVTGNKGARMQGFHAWALWYHGYQPSWYCQLTDNELLEGNYYHWTSATESIIGLTGAKRGDYKGPLNLGGVVRRNRLDGNSHIRINGAVRDAVIELNRVENADVGVQVSKSCERVLQRENQFTNVLRENMDESYQAVMMAERAKAFSGKPDPIAVWSFENLQGNSVADDSGHGFAAAAAGSVTAVEGKHGKGAAFGKQSFLRVESGMILNLPSLTLSLWINPSDAKPRQGLVVKRMNNTLCPYVLSLSGGKIGFEACDVDGKWDFNFSAPTDIPAGAWTHVAAVIEDGKGVILYVNGQPVATKENPAVRAVTSEPLVLGREAWATSPAQGGAAFFEGVMDDVKIWGRVLTAAEILAEFEAK